MLRRIVLFLEVGVVGVVLVVGVVWVESLDVVVSRIVVVRCV